MATVEQRIRILQEAGAPQGLMGVTDLVAALKIFPYSKGEKIVRRWWNHGLRYDGKKPFVFPPIEAVREWLNSEGRHGDLIEIANGWARFRLTKWTGFACRACKRSKPLETPNRRRLGPHALARVERGRVIVRCWCSAKITHYDPSELPTKDVERLPKLTKEEIAQ